MAHSRIWGGSRGRRWSLTAARVSGESGSSRGVSNGIVVDGYGKEVLHG